jgi:hypothetical protein
MYEESEERRERIGKREARGGERGRKSVRKEEKREGIM